MIANSKYDEKLKVENNKIEEVERFIYLDANVSNKSDILADIKKRIALASGQMKQLANIWNTSGITNRTKVILFKSLILSVLLYGSETWKLTKGEETKLDVFQMRCLRGLYKIRWQQHVPNREVLERAELTAVSEEVRRRRWNWIGQVMRMRHHGDCAMALDWRPDGKRNRGRPKTM